MARGHPLLEDRNHPAGVSDLIESSALLHIVTGGMVSSVGHAKNSYTE